MWSRSRRLRRKTDRISRRRAPSRLRTARRPSLEPLMTAAPEATTQARNREFFVKIHVMGPLFAVALAVAILAPAPAVGQIGEYTTSGGGRGGRVRGPQEPPKP